MRAATAIHAPTGAPSDSRISPMTRTANASAVRLSERNIYRTLSEAIPTTSRASRYRSPDPEERSVRDMEHVQKEPRPSQQPPSETLFAPTDFKA